MIKWLIISGNFLVALFMSMFFDSEIAVKVSAPQEVTAGNEFQVTLTIQKGKLESFSRLMQEIPAGLKATPISSANADFTFKDNKLRMIWLKLPESDSVTVTYSIKVDKRLKGTFDLAGKFSYIESNERQTVEANPVSIKINPNPDIDPKLIVDIKDFTEKVIPEITPTGLAPVACIRQTPSVTGDADNSYVVNLLVYKDVAQKFAKIEETVPSGYTAIKIDSKDGIFVFKDGKAKILWMNLPSGPYFTVSYRLVPNQGVTTPPALTGQFSYVIDEKTLVKEIVQKDVILASLSADDIRKLVNEINTPVPVENLAVNTPSIDTVKKKDAPVLTKQNVAQQVTKKKNWYQKQLDRSNTAYMLEPEDGVYFRVQIAAGHKPINIQRYFKRFKISDEVRKEVHDGWVKYSIGSYQEYVQARDYRVHIWNTTPIADAFVSAYNSGKRITVQEALMITNQKWYK